MIVTSGEIPYKYSFDPLPIRSLSAGHYGYSGIIFEQPMFVHKAEMRRYKPESTLPSQRRFYKYIHPSGSKIEIEPTASGAALSDGKNPGSTNFIDYIRDGQINLDIVLLLKGGDAEISLDPADTTLLEDYLTRMYPSTPSGAAGLYSHNAFDGPIGIQAGTNPDLIGVSGALYDTDIGELMYQPYPHLRETVGLIAPISPAFMSPGGGLATNSRSTDFSISGKIRVQGDVLTPDTKYLLRNASNVETTFGAFYMGGARDLGNGRADPLAEVFITPQAQSVGVYHVGVRNDLADFPHATMASGLASVWPLSSSYNADPPSEGFHVFTDSIWGTRGSAVGALGLRVVSSVGPGRVVGGLNGETAPNHFVGGGMEKVGSNIFRSQDYRLVSSPFEFALEVTTYNLDLDYVSIADVTTDSAGGSAGVTTDMLAVGSDFYTIVPGTAHTTIAIVKHGAPPSTGEVFVHGYPASGVPGPNMESLYDIGGELWYGAGSNTVTKIEFDDSPLLLPTVKEGRIMVKAETKTVDFTAVSQTGILEDLINVTGAAELANGIWGIFLDTPNSKRWLMRMTSSGASLIVQEAILADFTTNIGGEILHMSV